ncbi:MAG: hypothetical protein LBR84_03450 [Tannerella sp.]|jgi:hypothetical protein|nr:hypothetical protein [Tannerella sp.]
MKQLIYKGLLSVILISASCSNENDNVAPILPSNDEIHSAFGNKDVKMFHNPPKVYHPETWFHFIGGNVSKQGITTDLEAIADAGISGIQLFHGQFGGPWPGVNEQITCLSPSWDDAVRHVAEECRRLGLRFTMQNCPGWAMSGGPWIKPENAMRNLTYSRTDVEGPVVDLNLPINEDDWRDYMDIAVLAFPTPADDTNQPLKPLVINSKKGETWKELFDAANPKALKLQPSDGQPHWVEIQFSKPVTLRTIEFSSVNGFNHNWCYEPGINVTVNALSGNVSTEILNADMPQSSWSDNRPISLSCSGESLGKPVQTYSIQISNMHEMNISHLRFYTAARNNNWEAEAGWTLRSMMRQGEDVVQSPETWIDADKILDISDKMDATGRLQWTAPEGRWTILRIGHFNTGRRNSPAPPEGTGWECDKLSTAGPDAHFAGYIGRLNKGPLAGGLLNGMLMDSWECGTQTWTTDMEAVFADYAGYPLRKWIPAVFGYVVGSPDTTARFLLDWRGNIGDLFANKFYGRMAELARENGLAVQYETAAGDIFPADIMEYYKHADVPMTEFWQPFSDGYVGSLNYKPIKPTASAARLYGKTRVAAEAFTSFSLTWDEHLSMLKEVFNVKAVEGVTHLIFHTYTHNPQQPFLPPGTAFGSSIGTPFLRGQTWWQYMPDFVAYLSRCNYLLERGRPVSDVLWYIGDEIDHKPDQNIEIEGYKYDYCNPDMLLNRLSVKDRKIVTPEGLTYRVLWIPENRRMRPETLEKIGRMIEDGAVVIAEAPQGLATLSGGAEAQERFDRAVKHIWGDMLGNIRMVGKGLIIMDNSTRMVRSILKEDNVNPDVTGGDAIWLHRQTEGADWYFVSAPQGRDFKGELSFRCTGRAEIWDPLTGDVTPLKTSISDKRSTASFDLPYAGSCFVVFRHDGKTPKTNDDIAFTVKNIPLDAEWTLTFPAGWGAPESLKIKDLKAWKDLDISDEGRAFSGTVRYSTSFDTKSLGDYKHVILDLGRVEMIASVSLNGKKLSTLWSPPYSLDITKALIKGENKLEIDVTGTWFNRLVFDAGQPEADRKTWTISAPANDSPLRESGLLGPTVLITDSLF